MVASKKAKEALAHLLDGFERREDPSDIWAQSTMVRIEPRDLPVPGILLFLLTRIMGCVNLGRDEKTAWHVPLAFNGHRITVANQKFGLRMYVVPAEGSAESAEDIATEVTRRLLKALKIVEREVLVDHAREQLEEGRITLSNQSGRLRVMYHHFRDAAAAAFEAAENPAPPKADDAVDELFAEISEQLHRSQVGAWEAIAAVNAYFSVLEHELVLVSAFTDLDPTGGKLQELIGDRWGRKFQKVFDITGPDAKRVYDRLHRIAEAYRNPYSHGGFEKGDAPLWFHLEGIGAVPARLSDIRTSSHFELFPVQPEGFRTICEELDETDQWLRDGQYGGAFAWIDASLDIAFDPSSRSEYRELVDDPERLREEIHRQSVLAERMMNFDF